MPVPTDQERHRRVVEEDSKRKRDLAGYRRVEAKRAAERMAKDRERIAGIASQPSSAAAWEQASARIAASVPESTFKLWLEPLSAVGAEGTTLFLAATHANRCWVERRYAALIREALQGTGYTDVAFVSDYQLGEVA